VGDTDAVYKTEIVIEEAGHAICHEQLHSVPYQVMRACVGISNGKRPTHCALPVVNLIPGGTFTPRNLPNGCQPTNKCSRLTRSRIVT
jgi:hypothetical protein